MPAHAGRLRPVERCVFTVVFATMASFVVLVAFMASTTRGHLLLTGPSVAQPPVAAGLTIRAARGGTVTSRPQAGHAGSGKAGTLLAGAEAQRLDAQLAGALQPVLGGDPGQLAVGVIDVSSGATATFDATVPIRGGAIVTTDILAALLLMHQEAGTPVSNRQAELAADMMAGDSASATSQLWDIVGGAGGLAAANAALKLRDTTLAPGGSWMLTKTTVADQLQLLADLTTAESPLKSAARDYALGLMANVAAAHPWGVLAAGSPGAPGAIVDGSLLGPRWVIGSIGVVERHGHELLIAVLSDRNPAEAPAVSAARAAVVAAASVVS